MVMVVRVVTRLPAIRSVKAFRAQPADTSKTLIGYLRIVSNLEIWKSSDYLLHTSLER